MVPALLLTARAAEPPTDAALGGTWYLFDAGARSVRWSCNGGPPRLVFAGREVTLALAQDASAWTVAGDSVAGEVRTLESAAPDGSRVAFVSIAWAAPDELSVTLASGAVYRGVQAARRGDVPFLRECCAGGGDDAARGTIPEDGTCPEGTRPAGVRW